MLEPIFRKFLFLVVGSLFFITLPAYAALVNINTADLVELETLTGIGPTYAQRIIEYRTENGSFKNKQEIKNVRGIGDVTYSNIKDYITVGDMQTPNTKVTDNDNFTKTQVSNIDQEDSAHYSSVPVSSTKPAVGAAISAGRDRIGATGSPMEFVVGGDVSVQERSAFEWSFGDGTVTDGGIVTHVYEYPGNYALVLRADSPKGEAVSRIDIKIIEPELRITEANQDRIEIENSSAYEVSLYGRALLSGKRIFAIPKDTIIKSGARISLSTKITGLHPSGIEDVRFVVIGEEHNVYKIEEIVKEYKMKQISRIREDINNLQNRVDEIQSSAYSQASLLDEAKSEVHKESDYSEGVEKEGLSQTTAVIEALPSESYADHGWLDIVKKFFLRK